MLIKFLKHFANNPRFFKAVLNLWGPYWGTGISVTSISKDFREVSVQMRSHWYNRNYVNVHFGGSLFAMTDPFYMLMLMHNLGKDYIVWDKAAGIKYIQPGRGPVHANFKITEEQIQAIKKVIDLEGTSLSTFEVRIENEANELVALVTRHLYVKPK